MKRKQTSTLVPLRLYGDGTFSALLTGDGGGWCSLAGKRLTGGNGIVTVQRRTAQGWETVLPHGGRPCRGTEFTEERAVLVRTADGFAGELTLEPRLGLSGLRLSLRYRSCGAGAETLRLTLQPMLLEEAAWAAHPAFAKLAVVSEEAPGGVVFTRRPRGAGEALSLAVLWEGACSGWDTCRAFADAPAGHTGGGADPQLTLVLPVSPGRECTLTLALAAGEKSLALRLAEGIRMGLTAGPGQSPLWAQCHLTEAERLEADAMLSHLLGWRTAPAEEGAEGPQALWPFGISGDLPLVAMELTEATLEDAARYCAEHSYLNRAGCPFDLALLLREPSLEAGLKAALAARQLPDTFGGSGGVHLVTGQQERWEAIQAAAVCTLRGGQLLPRSARPVPPEEALIPVADSAGTLEWRWEEERFVLHLRNQLPPRRWSHLLANPRFGWLTDECGTGFLWQGNAHENQLTPWQGDPLALRGGEDLLLCWGGERLSCFARLDGAETTVTYGPGFACWHKTLGNRTVTMTAQVPLTGAERRITLSLAGFLQPVTLRWRFTPLMGERRQEGRYLRVREEQGAVIITNPANQDFPGQQLRLSVVGRSLEFTREGDGALVLTCPAGEGLELLASAVPASASAVGELIASRGWPWLCSPLRAETPDEGLNHYLNFWCLYQVAACRLFGRTGLYQCGGAYGFRDQLQDVCALMGHAPEVAREHLLRAAAHQFPEGDVQHWWHPDGTGQPERGVRTRISDDLLWLPYALSLWMEITGDLSLLREQAGFLESEPLAEGELERYERPGRSPETASLYEHGVRAVHCAISRGTGSHGLLLMGAGDWNDGLNRVGAEGNGESVWLTWFAALVLERWSQVAKQMGDASRATRCAQRSRDLAAAANRAWDGDWYLRGYTDDGTPFGGKDHPCYTLDSLPQSFSVFAPNPDPQRGRQAVQSAVRRLYDPERGTVALLTPGVAPGSGMGYLQSYPEGIRENGGQYTHAAVWLAMACFRLGLGETGWQLLRALLPEHHASGLYQGEPYVLAGDVSTAPGYEGRCGWSWYTGAAAWYYRAASEELLGLRVRREGLTLAPCLPEGWEGYRATLRLPGGTFRITVHAGGRAGVLVNGAPVEGAIPLPQGGETAEVTAFTPRGGQDRTAHP